jgi:hypothetical protein
MIAAAIYALCALSALLCAWMLFAAYRRSGYPLLFWSSVFFALTTATNTFLVLDKLVFPDIDLSLWRHGVALLAIGILLYGLVWSSE